MCYDIPYTRTRCIRILGMSFPTESVRLSVSREFGVPRAELCVGRIGIVEVYFRAVR